MYPAHGGMRTRPSGGHALPSEAIIQDRAFHHSPSPERDRITSGQPQRTYHQEPVHSPAQMSYGSDEFGPLVHAQTPTSTQFRPPRPPPSSNSIAANEYPNPHCALERRRSPVQPAANSQQVPDRRRSSQNSLNQLILFQIEQPEQPNTRQDREVRKPGIGDYSEASSDDAESDEEGDRSRFDDYALRSMSMSISSTDSNYSRAPRLEDSSSNSTFNSRKPRTSKCFTLFNTNICSIYSTR